MEITNNIDDTPNIHQVPLLDKLTRDLKASAGKMPRKHVRFCVDSFYKIQRARIDSEGQIRAITQGSDEGVTHELLTFIHDQFSTLEKQMKASLGSYAKQQVPGAWLQSIYGIADVISAGLLAYIDITKAPHAGNLMRFAGLTNDEWLGAAKAKTKVDELRKMATDPDDLEELIRLAEADLRRSPGSILNMMKGVFADTNEDEDKFIPTIAYLIKTLALRPWCAALKCLAVFKMGESFVKTQNLDGDVYGKLFAARKAMYTVRNEQGGFAADAKAVLEEKTISKSTDAYAAYSQGMLPKAHIHARARRWAVKNAMVDLHAILYYWHYKRLPGLPYVVDILGHSDFRLPPNLHLIPGMAEEIKRHPKWRAYTNQLN